MNSENLKCDVCGLNTVRNESFILSTQEVTSSQNYWKDQLSKYKSIINKTKGEENKLKILIGEIHRMTNDSSAWLVCIKCSDKFDFDRRKAKEYALNPSSIPNLGTGDFEKTAISLEPMLLKFCRQDSPKKIKKIMTKKYWQCNNCGVLYEKEAGNRRMNEQLIEIGTPIMGGITCQNCHHRHNIQDVFSGKYDMYSDDDIIDLMIANQSEVGFDDETKIYTFRGKIIKGPTSKQESPSLNIKTQQDSKKGEKKELQPNTNKKNKWWEFWK